MGARAGELRGLRNLLAVTCSAALVLCTPAGAAPPAPEVDQSFTASGSQSVAAAINDCCDYVAQTFTAGRDGLLAGVNIDTDAASTPDGPLRVSIRDFEGGVPGDTVLATTLLPSALAPLTQLVTFPQRVRIRAGVKYAIVVNLEDPLPLRQANWSGGFPDPYPRGEQCMKRIGTETWFCYSGEEGDLHFRTYVMPLGPRTRRQCRHGGWQHYGFKSRRQCIAFVRAWVPARR